MKVDLLARSVVTSVVARPRAVLTSAVIVAAAVLAAAGVGLEIKTSNLDLVDPALPEVSRFRRFAAEFGTPNFLVIVFEGAGSAELGEAVDRVEPGLESVEGVQSVMARSPQDESLLRVTGESPYLTSDDGQLFFVFVRPEDAESRAETIGPLVDGVRRVLARSGLDELGVRAGLTGIPAYAIDDRDVIREDISLLSGLSFVLVLVLFAVSFGALRRPLLVMMTLLTGVAAALGVAAAYPGHLTLLSAFFVSILFGLGVDYGIHIVDRVEELVAGGASETTAVIEAVTAVSPGLVTGGLTTASVFFAMELSGFRGFAELGTIAGIGILLCLAAMVTVLPALLVTFPPSRSRVRALEERRVGRALLALQKRPVAWTLGLAALAGLLVGAPEFDSDYLNLQPAGSEAVRLEREMVWRSEFSPQFAAFTVGSLEEVRSLQERLLDRGEVGAVHSVADFGYLSPFGAQAPVPDSLLAPFKSSSGRYAVYAYPAGDIWDPGFQETFLGSMSALDGEVTGMPFLGRFMVNRSKRALHITAGLGALILPLWVWLDFRAFRPTVAALLPTVLTVVSMSAVMRLLGIDFNPLNVMALPVVLGIAVDDGVHLVHRYLAENGDLRRTLAGTGRSVVLTSMTTMAAFGLLAFASHRGLASFAVALTLGVTSALAFTVLVLPSWLPALLPNPVSRPAGGEC